jgi:hypothetical protein
MKPFSSRSTVSVVLLAAGLLAAQTNKQTLYRSPNFGYQIYIPAGWSVTEDRLATTGTVKENPKVTFILRPLGNPRRLTSREQLGEIVGRKPAGSIFARTSIVRAGLEGFQLEYVDETARGAFRTLHVLLFQGEETDGERKIFQTCYEMIYSAPEGFYQDFRHEFMRSAESFLPPPPPKQKE